MYTIGLSFYSLDISGASSGLTTLAIILNSLIIQLSDQNSACQTDLFIKQFATRTKTLPGLFNAIFTAVYGIGFNYATAAAGWTTTPTEMNAAYKVVQDTLIAYFTTFTPMDCQVLGKNFGILWSQFLEAKIDSTIPEFKEDTTFTKPTVA